MTGTKKSFLMSGKVPFELPEETIVSVGPPKSELTLGWSKILSSARELSSLFPLPCDSLPVATETWLRGFEVSFTFSL